MNQQYLGLLFFCLGLVQGKSVCTDEQLTEAQRSFRNCVESAKAGIVSAHANEADEQLVCSSLENMLAGCETQVRMLAHCTDRHHVANLKAIHLSSITDVIKAINHKVDVSSCSVYTEKTVIPVTSSSNEVSRLSQEPSKADIPVASSSSGPVWLSLWLLSTAMSLSCALRD